MKEKLLLLLKTLYQSARKELSERPIATSGVLATLFAVTIPLVLSKVARGFVSYQVSRVLTPNIELSLFPLTVTVFVLVLAACLPHTKKEKEKKDHYFIQFDDFTWKVKLFGDRKFNVDKTPYCKLHQIKLIELAYGENVFACPFCGSENSIKLTINRKSLLHTAVTNLAEAQVDKHILTEG